MKFSDFIQILLDHGFELHRKGATSHAVYMRAAPGELTRIVVVAAHKMSDDIKPGTLSAMIRQSGISKKAFR